MISTAITDLDKELEMKISRIKYSESKTNCIQRK